MNRHISDDDDDRSKTPEKSNVTNFRIFELFGFFSVHLVPNLLLRLRISWKFRSSNYNRIKQENKFESLAVAIQVPGNSVHLNNTQIGPNDLYIYIYVCSYS